MKRLVVTIRSILFLKAFFQIANIKTIYKYYNSQQFTNIIIYNYYNYLQILQAFTNTTTLHKYYNYLQLGC